MYKEKLEEVTFGTFLGIVYNITKDKEQQRKYFISEVQCLAWLKCFKSTSKNEVRGLLYQKLTENEWILTKKVNLNGKFGYFLTKQEFNEHKELFFSDNEIEEIQIKMEF